MAALSKVIFIPDGEKIPEDVKAELKTMFESNLGCQWCGGIHHGQCPRVKKISYHPNDDRQIREIEFWSDLEWDKSRVVFLEDLG
jgi:hypothetical protein